MRRRTWRVVSILMALGLPVAGAAATADPDIDGLLQGPIGKDWVSNGGNLTNQRYSTLKQIDPTSVKQLKGAWMTHLKGSGLGGKYSFEATPVVKDGVLYISTGNDDVFALNAKTGEIIWERWSGIDQKLTSVCCGWDNRGVAIGEGMVFLGQLDANVVALEMKTGKEVWKTQIETWQDGYGITSAPLYYDGIVYTGITGGEYGVRGRLTALDAKTGKILWRSYTLPGPGEVGSETWPAGTDQYSRGGAAIWNTPALDPQLGLVYFAVGNCGPDYDGAPREGDNLFCASVVALNAKTGAHVWHFQEVHHDIWDYDAASPVVLFDTTINGEPHKGIAQAGRTGWVYILDRTNGKPLVGVEERPVPQEPRQKTAKTQPFPIGDAFVPQCAQPMPEAGYEKAGCIFEVFWEEPVLVQPSGVGGNNWSPMSYNPVTGAFYVPATIRTSAFARYDNKWAKGKRYDGGTQAAPIGSEMSGTFTAIGGNTNKILWQNKMPYRIGTGSGSATTAGGVVFHGEPDGNFLAFDARTGKELWRFQTGYGADAPPAVYEVDGEQYVAIGTGGNQGMLSANGDVVWAFSLKGQLGPQSAPPPPLMVAGPAGPLRDDVDEVKIGANNMEYVFFPGRTKVKAGTTLTFTNAGDTPHTATSFESGKIGNWDTGVLNSGESKKISFDKPGNYFYICTPHPWMYGQIVVE
jgi:quinohemoprotein ethanol dehydrogenase